mgnify:CR=1 FL=1
MTEHPYELLVNSLLALHLLGFGTIFGYAVTQIPNFKTGAKVQPGLIHGTWLSLVTALAMVAHEIPQEIGDFIVLLNAGLSKTRAYVYNLICSFMSVIGGVVGYYALGNGLDLIPYVLVLASSGFIYIAVSDLMPQMQRRATWRETVPQVLLIAVGVAIVLLLTQRFHVR